MKHSFSAVLVLLFAISCSTKPNGKELILGYLQENTDGIEYSIIEVSGPDSLYSPTERISSLILQKSKVCAELTKQLADAFDKPTKKDRIAAAQEVVALADKEYADQGELDEINSCLMNPFEATSPANRLGFRAKYKVDGQLKEDVFYLERHENAVGHTASGMMNRYLQLCDLNGRLFQIKSEAEEAVQLMRWVYLFSLEQLIYIIDFLIHYGLIGDYSPKWKVFLQKQEYKSWK